MKDQKDIFKDIIPNGFHKSTPSANFTNNVMANIEKSLATQTVFEPLISKKWWVIIGSCSTLIILTSFIYESQFTLPSLFSTLTFPNFENYKTSIQLTGLILFLLSLLTLTDLIYRKYKHIIK